MDYTLVELKGIEKNLSMTSGLLFFFNIWEVVLEDIVLPFHQADGEIIFYSSVKFDVIWWEEEKNTHEMDGWINR